MATSETKSDPGMETEAAARAVGGPVPAPKGSLRARLKDNPAVAPFYRAGVFVVGLFFIILGGALAVLPGPLTIPPILLGLWIWSTEFQWAKRFFDAFRRKAAEAWIHAKAHPVSSTLLTVGGIVLAIAVVWAVRHFDLVARARDFLGL